MDSTPSSEIRRQARTIIHEVIDAHVRGPVQILPKADLRELRPILRAAYPWPDERKGWKLRVWRQEIRAAIGYQVRRAKRAARIQPRPVETIMPAMRAWAQEKGLIAEPQPSPAQPSPAQPSPAQPSPAQPSPAQHSELPFL